MPFPSPKSSPLIPQPTYTCLSPHHIPIRYLAHIGKYYDSLTDGIFFMQADPRHAPSHSLQQIVSWAHDAGIAPVVFYPLGSKQSAVSDET